MLQPVIVKENRFNFMFRRILPKIKQNNWMKP